MIKVNNLLLHNTKCIALLFIFVPNVIFKDKTDILLFPHQIVNSSLSSNFDSVIPITPLLFSTTCVYSEGSISLA